MSNFFRGTLALVVGPSGVGKGTTVSLLKKRHPEWIFPVSATTRPPRPKEKEGETYHFFSPETFDKKITDGEFLEWAWVHKKTQIRNASLRNISPSSKRKSGLTRGRYTRIFRRQKNRSREILGVIFFTSSRKRSFDQKNTKPGTHKR
jgi:hypothetical protein